MIQIEWSKKTETEMKSLAKEISKHITIRTYSTCTYNSVDITRESTEAEAKIIYGIVYSAMLAYGHNIDADLKSILDTAEFTSMQLLKNVNSYDTIYIPLQKTMGNWA